MNGMNPVEQTTTKQTEQQREIDREIYCHSQVCVSQSNRIVMDGARVMMALMANR